MTTTLTVVRGECANLNSEVMPLVVKHLNQDKTNCLFLNLEPSVDLSLVGFSKNVYGEYKLSCGDIKKYVRVIKDVKNLKQSICASQFNLIVASGAWRDMLYPLSRLRSGFVKDLDFILLLKQDEKLCDEELENLLPKNGETISVCRVGGKWVNSEEMGAMKLRYLGNNLK